MKENKLRAPLLTPAEVAQLLQISEKALAQWRSNGLVDLPFIKLSGRVRYEPDAVYAFIQSRRMRHTGDAIEHAPLSE